MRTNLKIGKEKCRLFRRDSVNQAFDGPDYMSDSFTEFLARLQSQEDAAAQELFDRFARRLIALAHRHIAAGLRHRIDPEDVVQSAYKSFFRRYDAGKLDIVNWNSLWGLLALITVRKCAHQAEYHGAARRNAAREVSLKKGEDESARFDPFGREPTPLEAAVLSETVDRLLAGLDEDERPILELSLQGHTTREISERLGRAERTIRLLRERVRHRLERMRREGS
jgi:RNA polymerase sigma-70 factor (ECF subfamily)